MKRDDMEKEKIMNGKTPKNISESDEVYTVPIYQRLFEWDIDKIDQLLGDLWSAFNKNKTEPYYIGMLTSKSVNDWIDDLVDGQQRFTVMTLLGIEMKRYNPDWQQFLTVKGDETRLRFSARPEDQKYLECKIFGNELSAINIKMEKGLEYIKNWLLKREEQKDFCEYVYEKLTFFVSKLPDCYQGRDLNKYFESMNSTGRNLENHEIQKIECLKKLNNTNLTKEDATKIWNIVSQMDKPIISTLGGNEETVAKRHERFENALNKIYSSDLSEIFGCLNDFKGKSEGDTEPFNKAIKDIEESKNMPEKHIRSSNYHGMLSFSEFLLQVLYIQLGLSKESKPDEIKINDFFDVQKLLNTFESNTGNWTSEDWRKFFVNLLKYRLLFDYYIIRIPNDEDGAFKLEYTDNDENDENKNEQCMLIQYQALLYAGSSSKSFYLWLNPFFLELDEFYTGKIKPACKDLLRRLKSKDNSYHKLENVENLNYQENPSLYWFRRLDYYLWEQNLKNSDKVDYKLINDYRFRRGGRSIEHLQPQNQNEQTTKWDESNIHRFGNLALISSSFNSTQSNDSLSVKFARVKNQIDRKQLESIKLYKMYLKSVENGGQWTEKLAEEHENEMYHILEESFNQEL